MQIDFAKCDFGNEEIEAVNKVMAGTWLASGKENEAFEKEFAEYIGSNYAICVNSGSSANLLALASLNLPDGSNVLTSACGFPATLSPILHLKLTPILVDYNIETHNIDIDQVIEKIPGVKAIIFAHTLGNPADVIRIKKEAGKYNVKIIEDCCEAVGSSIDEGRLGSFGDLGTYSFYPAHQMTALGGGGMIVTNDKNLYQRMKSLRDWGKMYDWDSSFGGVNTDYSSSIGYHRGYTYETIGWNFKLPEANCAFGREQLKRLDKFKAIRLYNWNYLYCHLKNIPEIKIAQMSMLASPFGFCMDVEERDDFGLYLERNGIMHRPFFAGNILRQPAFKNKIAGDFPIADKLMKSSLFIGCHTKLTKQDMDYMAETIHAYFSNSKLQWTRHARGIYKVGSGAVLQA